MTNENLVLWLRRHKACAPALDWLGDRDLATAWEECESPEWMIWACDHAGISDATMRMLACRFVRETPMGDGRMVWDMLTDERSRTAVNVAERYANGEATAEELRSAGAAAWAARAAAAERAWASAAESAEAASAATAGAWASAAARAAASAARAAASAAESAAAASAATAGAWASAAARAAASAAESAAAACIVAQCRIIREMISVRDIESAMEVQS